jgi:protein phosphatase
MRKNIEVTVSHYTTAGKKEENQDFHEISIPKEPLLITKGVAFAIADGISSSPVSGEASKVTVLSFLEDYFSTPETWSVEKSGKHILEATNSWLYSQTRKSQYEIDREKGFVCTFSGVVLNSRTAHIFHIGDSRVYRFRNSKLEQLTEDHRVYISKNSSYLSRAMGSDSKVNIDFSSVGVEKGDIFLLMSDGVYEFLDDKFLKEKLENSFESSAKEIVQKSLDLGSDDNLTLQIVRVDEVSEKSLEESLREEKPFPKIPEVGDEFDGFKIVRDLSRTSRSHVYLATCKEERVVIKVPSIETQNDSFAVERFLLEEWIAKRVNSKHVLKPYQMKREKSYIYNVSEYIDGVSLAQWIVDNPKPQLETVRKIVEDIGKGLQAFHRMEMIHKDIRSENILLDRNGVVKIIDFGSTKVQGVGENHHSLLGTALYSAPEYFLNETGTNRSDIFSLAVLTYHLLSGKFPYGVEIAKATTSSAQKKLKYRTLYPKLPIWIDETLRKGLAINPNERYSELSEFLYDLRNPNQKYLQTDKPPLLEREPETFWKYLSLFFGAICLFRIIT